MVWSCFSCFFFWAHIYFYPPLHHSSILISYRYLVIALPYSLCRHLCNLLLIHFTGNMGRSARGIRPIMRLICCLFFHSFSPLWQSLKPDGSLRASRFGKLDLIACVFTLSEDTGLVWLLPLVFPHYYQSTWLIRPCALRRQIGWTTTFGVRRPIAPPEQITRSLRGFSHWSVGATGHKSARVRTSLQPSFVTVHTTSRPTCRHSHLRKTCISLEMHSTCWK